MTRDLDLFFGVIGSLVAACLLVLICCSPAQTMRTALNVSAAAANAAAPRVLEAQCRAELQAINHMGDYVPGIGGVGGRCVRSDEPRAATPQELEALGRLRAQWSPVQRAYEAFAGAHDAARVVADQPSLARVVEAYGALRVAAHAVGLELPGVP